MSDGLKICFLQHDLGGGGAERKVCTLANYFVSQGCQVEIGLFAEKTIAYELDERICVTLINRDTYEYGNVFEKIIFLAEEALIKMLFNLPAYVTAKVYPSRKITKGLERLKNHFEHRLNYIQPIKSYIKHRNDFTLITMMSQTYAMIMDVIAKDVEKGKINNPYIVMECNNPKPGMDATLSVDKKRNEYYPLATKCVVMNHGIKDYFNDEIQRKCVIIPNPVRNDLPEAYDGVRRKVVVNYCRLNKQKNLQLLINAFISFFQNHREYSLEIYGEGDQKNELLELIDKNGMSNFIHLFPFDPHIHDRIKDSMMYVSSSNWEGFPNSVMEAMSIGLPVISTNCEFGPSDLIENGKNGILVPVEDVSAMAAAMCLLADDEQLRRKLSQNATTTREKYDANIIGNQWLELIGEISRKGL